MSSYPFNSSFTKQFRQEQPSVTFCAEEKTYEQIVISTYNRAGEEEINLLGSALNEQLFDNVIIHRLLSKLTQKDSRDAQRLLAFIKETHQECRNHANAEPFTAQYYKHLLELLGSLQELLHEYDTNGQELLLGYLNACYFNDSVAVNQPVDSEEVATMHRIIEDYLFQVGEFYQYFHVLLQKETEQENTKSRVQVISHIAYYLDTLITCTEKMIINMEGTLDMLLEWEAALKGRESQSLFN